MIYCNEKRKVYTIFFSEGDGDVQSTLGKVLFKNIDEVIGAAKMFAAYNKSATYVCAFELTVPVDEHQSPTSECIWEYIIDDEEEPKEEKKESKKYS